MSRWARTLALVKGRGWRGWIRASHLKLRLLPGRVSPQGGVALDLDDIQGVEVGDKQVGLPVGCNTTGGQQVALQQVLQVALLLACLPKDSGRRLHLTSSLRLRLPYMSTNTPNSVTHATTTR